MSNMDQSLSFSRHDGSFLPASWPTLAMHPSTVIATVIAVLVVVLYWGSVKQKDGRPRPPGPRPWPIIGNLNLLSPLPHHDFQKLARIYGPIFRLHMGYRETFVITSPKVAEEVLKTHDAAFASRPHLSAFDIMFYDRKSISVAPYGPYWRFARKIYTNELLTQKRLLQFQESREGEILGALHSILDTCKDGTQPVILNGYEVGQVSFNIITRMMMNKTYFGLTPTEGNLTEAQAFTDTIKDVVEMFLKFELGNFIPIFKPFDLQGNKKRMKAVAHKNDTFLNHIMDERRELRSSNKQGAQEGEVMDFLDTLLSRPSVNNEKPLSDEQIKGILLDVMVAGTDSSSLSFEWAMAELLKCPAALKKAQAELDAVVGRDRLVREADLPRLRYISCIVKEVLRLHPAGPIMTPHECMETRVIGGYEIPAGSQVFVNIYAIMRDPDVWKNPLEFRPERFEENDMDMFGKNFKLLPFGSGRRSCPGMQLARVTVEYMLALTLQGCEWSLLPGVRPEDIDLEEEPGVVTRKKNPIRAIATPRLAKEIIYANSKAP